MDKNNEKQRRAEIKRAYKEMKKPAGVFQIKNNINGKIFIGRSFDTSMEYNKHLFAFGMNSHMNKELQKDWNEFGEKAFSYEVLELFECDDSKNLDNKYELENLEKKWLDKLQPYDEKGYNKRKRS